MSQLCNHSSPENDSKNWSFLSFNQYNIINISFLFHTRKNTYDAYKRLIFDALTSIYL